MNILYYMFHDILDIPFRNLYLIYKNAQVLGENGEQKTLRFQELDAFSIMFELFNNSDSSKIIFS